MVATRGPGHPAGAARGSRATHAGRADGAVRTIGTGLPRRSVAHGSPLREGRITNRQRDQCRHGNHHLTRAKHGCDPRAKYAYAADCSTTTVYTWVAANAPKILPGSPISGG